MAEVRLVDLEVIKRYSLALRRDAVPAEELLEALEASVATVRSALGDSDRRPARRTTRSTGRAERSSPPARSSRPRRSGDG